MSPIAQSRRSRVVSEVRDAITDVGACHYTPCELQPAPTALADAPRGAVRTEGKEVCSWAKLFAGFSTTQPSLCRADFTQAYRKDRIQRVEARVPSFLHRCPPCSRVIAPPAHHYRFGVRPGPTARPSESRVALIRRPIRANILAGFVSASWLFVVGEWSKREDWVFLPDEEGKGWSSAAQRGFPQSPSIMRRPSGQHGEHHVAC